MWVRNRKEMMYRKRGRRRRRSRRSRRRRALARRGRAGTHLPFNTPLPFVFFSLCDTGPLSRHRTPCITTAYSYSCRRGWRPRTAAALKDRFLKRVSGTRPSPRAVSPRIIVRADYPAASIAPLPPHTAAGGIRVYRSLGETLELSMTGYAGVRRL